MTSDPDDEAFTWEGDEHPTRAGRVRAGKDAASEAAVAPEVDATPASEPVPEEASGLPVPDEAAGETASAPLGNAALIGLGVLGGIYLLYAVGWVIGGLRITRVAEFLVSTSGQAPPTWAGGNLVAVWLAVAAPLIWFATVFVLTRGSRPWVRWAWLVVGAILLVPWPLLMAGVQS